jgi:hypothetical protein
MRRAEHEAGHALGAARPGEPHVGSAWALMPPSGGLFTLSLKVFTQPLASTTGGGEAGRYWALICSWSMRKWPRVVAA